MKSPQALLPLILSAASVNAHGVISSPPSRSPGDAMKAACGNQVEVNQASDQAGNIQGMLQVAASQADYNAAACNIWQCKGYKYEDNTATVQAYTAGQVVPIVIDIRAPHTGVANVSIVDTAKNEVIGSILKSWDVYASTATTIPADQKNFDITIPSDLGSQCSTAGACVIQWYWFAEDIDQTYEDCIDFTVSGSDSEPSASSLLSSSTPPVGPPVTVVATPSTLQTVVVTPTPSPTSSEKPGLGDIPDQTAIPSDVLTSVIAPFPTATPPPGTPMPSKPLPEGTTLKDLLEWLEAAINALLGN